MQRRHLRRVEGRRGHPAKPRQQVPLHDQRVLLRRPRFAAHRDIPVEPLPRQLAHRGAGREGTPRRRRQRLLARLDAGDDERRPAARLLRRDDAVASYRHPLCGLAARAGLHHVDLAPRGIHPDPEARQLRIPEHRILRDRERIHRAPRDRRRRELRHCCLLPRQAASGRTAAPMLPPTRAADAFSVSRARCA